MDHKTALKSVATTFFAASVASVSAFAAGPFETWNGADPAYQIQTGLGNETETNGYWFEYYDGTSYIDWVVYWEFPWEFVADPIIDRCGGLCGTAILKGGTTTEKQFVGFGFAVVGETSDTDYTLAAGDASAWDGLCVTYTSDADLLVQLGPGPIDNPNGRILDGKGPDAEPAQALSYPTATLPASKTGNLARIAWSDFKQIPSHLSAPIIDGETASKQLSLILFKLQADSGKYDFNICAVGPKDGICPEECGMTSEEVGIKVAHRTNETTTVKAILNNRTLSFTGVSHATAEILNSLGQVVARGAIEGAVSTMNLTHLDAGIYLVRVVGKSVNFTNRIVIK